VLIKSRMGISADGFMTTPEGVPAIAIATGFEVHLVGGPRTIRAFSDLGALDRLELVVLPMLLGEGLPLSPQGASPAPLTLLRAERTFPDGSAELVYTPA
jgi:dihydrofolate reductase